MDAIWQPALLPGRQGYHLVTCWQEGCKMKGHTLDARTYAEMDLSKYLDETSEE